jgi:hypothetical protein
VDPGTRDTVSREAFPLASQAGSEGLGLFNKRPEIGVKVKWACALTICSIGLFAIDQMIDSCGHLVFAKTTTGSG